MRVLITGITGFVGSHLAEFILREHPDVKIFGLKRWRSPMDNVRHIQDKVTWLEGDLLDPFSLGVLCVEPPHVIFHLAAQSYVPYSHDAPVSTLQTNVMGTFNLLETARYWIPEPIIHICSSSEVYGNVKEDEVPIKETNPLRPASPYAVSKVAEDMLGLQYFLSYGLKTIRTRAFTHTGPRRGEPFVVSNFAKQIAAIEQKLQEPILKVGNLESVRTFLDVRDLVRAYWLLIEKCLPGEVYNIGGTETVKVGDMLERLLALSPIKRHIKVEEDPSRLRPSDVTLQIPCVEKFKKATGWEPTINFETTLKDTLEYWRTRLIQ